MTCSHPPEFLRKTDNGEICCSRCGMVVSDFELDPGFTPASPLKTNIEYMSNTERGVLNATYDALRIIENLHIPVEKEELRNMVRRIVAGAKKSRQRFKAPEIVLFTVYEVMRLTGRLVSIKAYCKMLEEKFGIKVSPEKFYRLEVRVRKAAPDLKIRLPTVQQCIQQIAVILRQHNIIDEKYSVALTRYACMIFENAREEDIQNRNPWLVAASTILAADKVLKRYLNEGVLAIVSSLEGKVNIAKQAEKLYKHAPPVPPEYRIYAFRRSQYFG